MKRKFKYYALAWVILLAAFNAAAFLTPQEAAGMSKFGGAFWAGYIFITIAFIGQLVCAYLALNTNDKTRLFYNIPLITVSYTGLVLTLIFGALCMAIPDLPNWVGVIVCLLILALDAIAVIKAKASAELVESTDTKVREKTLFIRSLTADAEALLSRAVTPEAKAAARKVYEAVRCSDPVSSDALTEVEGQIALKFAEFSKAVTANAENDGSVAEELVALIGDRNRRCRLLK